MIWLLCGCCSVVPSKPRWICTALCALPGSTKECSCGFCVGLADSRRCSLVSFCSPMSPSARMELLTCQRQYEHSKTSGCKCTESRVVDAVLPGIVSPASGSLRAFWLALPDARLDEQNCLVLIQGTHFLDNAGYGSRLFYRQHYPALWQQALSLKQQGVRGLVVRGSPGIGKSWWLFVVLWEAAKRGWTVVLQHRKDNSRYLFKGSTVLAGERQTAFREELDAEDTLYLVDGESPTNVAAWTIAAVSPAREHYWEYNKEPAVPVRFMPVWSEEELLEAWRLLYPHLQKQLVQEVYATWGGSARYCLQWATDENKQKELRQAIKATDLGACIAALGALDSASAASNRILHFRVSDDYESATVVFASRFAERSLMSMLMNRGRADVQLKLTQHMGERAYASFVGVAFEAIFHNMLETGCQLLCRDLEHPSAEPFHLRFEGCQTHMLQNSDVSEVDTANYFIPLSKTFESVDAILKPHSVFLVTSAESHRVLGKGLESSLQLLPLCDTYKLYFVVPVLGAPL